MRSARSGRVRKTGNGSTFMAGRGGVGRHLDTCGFATVITAEVPRVRDEKVRQKALLGDFGPLGYFRIHAYLKAAGLHRS